MDDKACSSLGRQLHLLDCSAGRPFGHLAMGQEEGLSVGCIDMPVCSIWRPFGSAPMGENSWLCLG